MGDILDRARLHFRADEKRRVEVPEWGAEGAPLVLWHTPVTLADKQRLHNRYKAGGLQEMYAYTLIQKAQREDGSRAFTEADKLDLMNQVDPRVVERIAAQILGAPDLEAVEKN